MTRLIRRFLCLTLAALMLAALLPPSVMRSTAKAASAHGIVTLDGVNFRVGPSMKDKQLFRLSKGTIWESSRPDSRQTDTTGTRSRPRIRKTERNPSGISGETVSAC